MADVCQRHVRNVVAPPAGAAPRTMLGDRIALPLAPCDSVLERELASRLEIPARHSRRVMRGPAGACGLHRGPEDGAGVIELASMLADERSAITQRDVSGDPGVPEQLQRPRRRPGAPRPLPTRRARGGHSVIRRRQRAAVGLRNFRRFLWCAGLSTRIDRSRAGCDRGAPGMLVDGHAGIPRAEPRELMVGSTNTPATAARRLEVPDQCWPHISRVCGERERER